MHRISRGIRSAGATHGLAVALLILVAACEPEADASGAPEPVANQPPSECGDDAHVVTELFGAIETRIDWGPGKFACDGMARPDDEGLRMRFSGNTAGSVLDIIIAVPGLKRATPADELAATVTMTVNGSGRFFSTADLETCWADIERNEMVDNSGDRYVVGGMVYCVAPLAEVGNQGSITVQELDFASETAWGTP